MSEAEILVTCAKGVTPVLAREIHGLGLPVAGEVPAGVWTSGGALDAMRLNLHLRTGMRVLRRVDSFPCDSPDHLYRHLSRTPWEESVPARGHLCVRSSVRHPSIRDTRFANLVAKDAICDRLRDAVGERPDAGPDPEGAVVFLHWHGREASVYLDTSGEPLSHRGYRKDPWQAPMRETLAAAALLASGWDDSTALVNPMCGAGTLGVEAAWMAMRRAPGRLRQRFAFEHLLDFDPEAWASMRRQALANERPLPAPIILGDHDADAVAAARRNLDRADLAGGRIELRRCDVMDTPLPEPPGLVIVNPPYGERLGEREALAPLYRRIGDFFKQRCPGFTGAVFSGNAKLMKQVRLRPAATHTMFNARIECRLNTYELYR